MGLKTLIVDDEVNACLNIETYIRAAFSDVFDTISYAHNIDQASYLIDTVKPDIVFFDIALGEYNSLDYITPLEYIPFELIIVTAYSEYALKAFKLSAIDYILKPIDKSQIEDAIAMAIAKIKINKKHAITHKDIRLEVLKNKKQECLVLKTKNNFELIDFKSILYIQSNKGYSEFYIETNTGIKEYLSSYTILYYEELLPTDLFFRVHKGYIINVKKIKKINVLENPVVLLQQNITLPIGRRRMQDFLELIKKDKLLG